jgi:endogenous inhibitor of DNA gyrase (YacG/DUF329 family)
VPAEPRTCPICWTTFTAQGPNRGKHTYCSGRCRAEAGRRRTRDTRDANTTHTPAPKPYRPEPAALRDCPHCGQPVTIVALLTTPQIAAPQLATGTPDVIPLHRIRAT